MEVVAAVQAGVLNAKIVSRLVTNNLNAVGLTGIDRGSFEAENVNEELGFVGVPRVVGSVDWINEMIKNNIVPVFSSICRDNKGNLMNVNADIFTETLAAAINAECVFFVSDIQGVKLGGDYKNCINETEIINGIQNGEITDGMIPKLQSCIELLSKGIAKIWIGSKNLEDVFNDNCKQSQNGTWIILSA
jgi:acetylglutamate kinase